MFSKCIVYHVYVHIYTLVDGSLFCYVQISIHLPCGILTYRFTRAAKQIFYLFNGPEVDIKIQPHGRSKSSQPFFRTSTSTRKRISELAVSSTPKAVITDLTREKGGELEVRGFASLPCDCRQMLCSSEKQQL